jgi:hypothetical protein
MTLSELERLLEQPAAVVFGATPESVDAAERRLLAACHPDLHGGSLRAEELFKRVQSMAAKLRKPPVVIKGRRHSYVLGEMLAAGDVADVYEAASDGDQYIAKVSRVPGGDNLLLAEHESLAKIHTAAKDTTYRKYFPLPVESVAVAGKFPRRINVFKHEVGKYTLDRVLAKHGKLSGRHVGWLFKRLLVGLGFAHDYGIIHGAVLPQHVLVSPADHGIQLIGWGQSVKAGEPLRYAVASHAAWYPPEAKAKKPAQAATDIYMAAQCLERAIDDKAPTLQTFLRGCLLDGMAMRPGKAWALHEEFDAMLRQTYGKPRFVELAMP